LRREGRTILLTTHDLADVEAIADRVAILHRGRIVFDGPPDALADESGADDGPRFRVHAPPPAEAIARLGARLAAAHPAVGLHRVSETAFEIEPGRSSADLVLELAQWAAGEGLLITELRAGAQSLEDRYLALTGDRDVEALA
ncbi:MAG TPA: hypothetical protein VNL94_07670, partial [Candidatus Binatia bacterium]|nr:hypothetical protein [Candidatus Binatia bacterium]